MTAPRTPPPSEKPLRAHATEPFEPAPPAQSLEQSPLAQSLEPSPLAQAPGPSPLAQAPEPSPLAQALEPSPLAQSLEQSPLAQALEPLPLAKALEPSPMAQALEPSPMAQAPEPALAASLPTARLPRAPGAVVDTDGAPALGRFEGLAESFDWHRLAPPHARGALWRRFHHKRWHYMALATPEIFCAAAVVDVGWTNTAFAYVFDRAQRRVIAAFSRDGIPGLTASVAHNALGRSRFAMAGHRVELGPQGLTLRSKDFSIDAVLSGETPVMLAVGPALGGSIHATQKSGGLALIGSVTANEKTWPLDGGTASYDYSNGLLARDTAWRWASAHAPRLGFNLQAGYFGAHENALWLDGAIHPLAEAIFDYDPANPLAPWHISTADGLLDLTFTPEGARREDRNLIVAASRYVQPIGVFNGWVRAHAGADKVRIDSLVGVTEDHSSRW